MDWLCTMGVRNVNCRATAIQQDVDMEKSVVVAFVIRGRPVAQTFLRRSEEHAVKLRVLLVQALVT